jgi:peptidoglycan/xylan/chitin deacetylase (PgdA/CDA1 family)
MGERLFSFRWDVDHRACITDGLPRILDVCDEFGVKNTFFINMGRSTNLREWLGRGLRGSRAKLQDKEAVHLIKKIGWPRFMLETVLSRPVGRSLVDKVERVLDRGHELGLHGGADHVIWSRRLGELATEVLAADVADTLETYRSLFGQPAGFTSPGFQSDDRVKRIVERLGFLYDGDAIGGSPRRAEVDGTTLKHWTLPVTICGPRTIPFIEWHGARGSSDDTVIEELNRLLAGQEWTVLYGHPCYEGVHDGLLRRVFHAVSKAGFQFVTHRQMAERLEGTA